MTSRQVVLEGGSPWGFRIHGGCDIGLPIKISRVNPGSKAAQKGIREGDIISSINGTSAKNLDNSTAHSLLRNAGEQLRLSLNEDGLSSPRRRLKQTVTTTIVTEQKNGDENGGGVRFFGVEKTMKFIGCPSQCVADVDDPPADENEDPDPEVKNKKKKRNRGLQNVFRTIKLIALGKPKKRKLSTPGGGTVEVFSESPRLVRSVCVKDLRTDVKKVLRSPPVKPKRSQGRSPVLAVRKPGLRSPIIGRAGSVRSRKGRERARRFCKIVNETSFLSSIAEECFCK